MADKKGLTLSQDFSVDNEIEKTPTNVLKRLTL